MFDDFHTSDREHKSRQRFRGSMAAAFVIYGSSSAAIVAATATVQKAVEDELTQVEFAAPPEPPPPPPPPPVEATPKPAFRPKAKRPELAPPDKISDEKLKESNKELAKGEGGPVDGFLDGVEGGTGNAPYKPPPPPPPPKAEPLVSAVASGSNQQPKYSAKVRRQGIEGTVVVEFDVLENGTVANPRILSGPAELHELVLKAVMTWRFQPAHRGKTPVRSRMRKSVVFRLEDA